MCEKVTKYKICQGGFIAREMMTSQATKSINVCVGYQNFYFQFKDTGLCIVPFLILFVSLLVHTTIGSRSSYVILNCGWMKWVASSNQC